MPGLPQPNYFLPTSEFTGAPALMAVNLIRTEVRGTQQVAVITIDRIPQVGTSLALPHRETSKHSTSQHMKRATACRTTIPQQCVKPDFCSSGLEFVTLRTSRQEENYLVASPFKHSCRPRKNQRYISPGYDLKSEIIQHLEKIREEMTEEPPLSRKTQSGHLLKARLKPLHPVKVQGPATTRFQGFLPGQYLQKLQHGTKGTGTISW
ncbi:uncharacterized protein LOC115471907 isoform X2 [Microcaecilia unicolor]|uniref:Uncharacterized protein LOC115471907 isoform X2 n=1 Tax=Microcaecilia unicolor TaxID=1415580 RepID=A0A6P7YFR2_9AMPH|nr:uncharacterized protein LOC115471907 isoform X2 [Microcaecilia unicolor]